MANKCHKVFLCHTFLLYLHCNIKTNKHMTHTRFNRHESMNSETLSEIMDIKKALWMRDDVTDETDALENMLSGLFDGFLYEELQILALKLPTDLATRIMKVYFTCSRFPKSESQVF